MNFSLLMSIYYKEKPEFFDRAMKSIWDEQTIKPTEIVLVEDGELSDELYEIIEIWKDKLGDALKIIPLEKNMGLGDALNIGLQNCSYNIVARMDTDDIALSNRFEKQLEIMQDKNIDVCGSWVGEFDNDEKEIVSYRKVPETHEEIIEFAKKRNPINHPSVMYKKEVVIKAGGYKRMMWFEDYYLWIRMILNGAKFYNIQEPLVKMRAGYGQLQRRSGLKYAKNEFYFQKRLLELGFINKKEFFKNIGARLIVRLMPKFIIKKVYQLLRD